MILVSNIILNINIVGILNIQALRNVCTLEQKLCIGKQLLLYLLHVWGLLDCGTDLHALRKAAGICCHCLGQGYMFCHHNVCFSVICPCQGAVNVWHVI
jgi:hypothetical protein